MNSKNVDDRLSKLPEEICSHILSLMPTKYAARTSILSKRWRYTWTLVRNLDFDNIHIISILDMIMNLDIDDYLFSIHGLDSLTRLVDRVLEFCKSSQLKSFPTSEFYESDDEFDLFHMHLTFSFLRKSVSKWTDKAVRLNVPEFDIRLILVDLPSSLFTCKTLTKLRLDGYKVNFRIWDCPCTVNLPSLKSLDIIGFNVPHFTAFQSGCPILESLSLEVKWSKDEEDYILINIPTLKRLKLTFRSALCINKVTLDVPNLEYLFVGGELSLFFVMKDVTSLVEASVSSTYLSSYFHLFELLKWLIGVESLSVKNSFPYSGNPLFLPMAVFSNMKHLALKGFFHSGIILQFLERSPQLKHLCIKNVDAQPEESSLIEPKLVPTCMLRNLTTIKFSKCKGLKCDIELLEYMLGNGEVLKTLTIIWHNLCFEEEIALGAQLLKVPRASQHCEISFHGKCSLSNGS